MVGYVILLIYCTEAWITFIIVRQTTQNFIHTGASYSNVHVDATIQYFAAAIILMFPNTKFYIQGIVNIYIYLYLLLEIDKQALCTLFRTNAHHIRTN